MSSIVLNGDSSGSVTLSAPAVAGTTTQTLVANSGTLAPIVSGTSVASTSGTSIDFTGIPSWVKRITVMFNGVSTNGTSYKQIQLGSGSVQTTGYVSSSSTVGSTVATTGSSNGFLFGTNSASDSVNGAMTISLFGSNVWTASHAVNANTVPQSTFGGGTVTLSGTLDRIRITTANGTDTFDAGSINILWE